LAASWGGKDNGFGLAKCCSDDLINTFPESATTLHFEFYSDILKNSQGAIGSESGISLSSSGVFALPGSGNANINTSKVCPIKESKPKET
jgi:E3 ubiquitin-protein ligase HUWE1